MLHEKIYSKIIITKTGLSDNILSESSGSLKRENFYRIRFLGSLQPSPCKGKGLMEDILQDDRVFSIWHLAFAILRYDLPYVKETRSTLSFTYRFKSLTMGMLRVYPLISPALIVISRVSRLHPSFLSLDRIRSTEQ